MRIGIITIILLTFFISHGQERYYTSPVKIPLLLSGSFAELRSNHFHSGIDIKTQGVTGIPVYSVADGYLARIAVSPGGYGKALYINHPNGTTSVYGHLSRFNPAIEKYIKEIQYEKKSFQVDVQVASYLFRLKKGEQIALSGNSGSSGGPHLHFEIRDTKSEEPLNPLEYNFPVTDNIPPKIFSVLIVPLSGDSQVNYAKQQQTFPVVFYDGKYHIKGNPAISVWGKIGVAVQANDYFNGTYNKCGINFLRMSVNNEEQFTFQLNRFSFDNSRYINSHMVYDEYMSSKRKYIKTWLDPGNQLPIYHHNGSMGIITPGKNKLQKVEIELQDSYGNTSVLNFSLKGDYKEIPIAEADTTPVFKYNRENIFSNHEVQVRIPKGALYTNFNFSYKKEPATDNFYTDYHFIHNKTVPLHKSASIKIKVDSLPAELESKVVMVKVDEFTGNFSAAGGTYNNGWVETSTPYLGVYSVTVDTIPPTIIPLSISANKLTESSRIRFKITDDLAGIKTIDGLLDGKWALFEYDAKTARITHYFDKDRFEFNKRHQIKLTVTDYRGNSSVYEAGFWK